MGNNEAYTIMEATVVGLYNLLQPKGEFTEAVLNVLCEPFRDSDIDHGGMEGLLTFDGLEADDVIVKVIAPDKFNRIKKIKDSEEHGDEMSEAWREIVRKRWHWY